MGVVFRSRRGDPPTPVAVKVLEKRADDRTRERFSREFEFMSGIRHPNVVSVHDYGEDKGRAYIVMDFVPGGSLADFHPSELTIAERVRYLAQACEGVQAVHDAGLIHRDIKPANILIGLSGEAQVTDFGIARTQAHGMTSTAGHLTGTLAHLAPEIVEGQRPSVQSDVYALGSTLYEVLAGHAAFIDHRLSVVDILRKIMWEEPPPLEDVPAPVVACVRMAMTKKPEDRFTTARGFGAALRAALVAAGLGGRVS